LRFDNVLAAFKFALAITNKDRRAYQPCPTNEARMNDADQGH
jgi:hypothetical protein